MADDLIQVLEGLDGGCANCAHTGHACGRCASTYSPAPRSKYSARLAGLADAPRPGFTELVVLPTALSLAAIVLERLRKR